MTSFLKMAAIYVTYDIEMTM